MPIDEETEISKEELDAFLGSHETGVLSLAQGDEPYSIPISFGYVPEGNRFLLRLVSTPESEKRQFLESSPRTRLVVYDQEVNTYWSVVASGTLREIEPSDLSVEDVAQYGQTKRPLFEIWGEGKQDLNVRLYELIPEEISGRRIEISREF